MMMRCMLVMGVLSALAAETYAFSPVRINRIAGMQSNTALGSTKTTTKKSKSSTSSKVSSKISVKKVVDLPTNWDNTYEALKEVKHKYKYVERDETASMLAADVARSDTFWDGTFSTTKKKRLTATQEKDLMKRLDIDKNFIKLNKFGFDRRMVDTYEGTLEEQAALMLQEEGPSSMVMDSAKMTSDQLELGASKDEQLLELQRKQLLNRTGPLKFFPQATHKYFDYLTSLRKDPGPGDLLKNMVVGLIFGTITVINNRARMAFLYSLVGNLGIMSILLARGTPKSNAQMGDRKAAASWSASSFKTAVGVTALFATSSALSMFLLMSFLPVEFGLVLKLRVSMAFAIVSSAYLTSFYEVYEEKSKNGWRWKRALEGFLSDDMQVKLKSRVFDERPMNELFNFNYDPQVDDFVGAKKYLDDDDESENTAGGTGEVDDSEAESHFENWLVERRDARKDPILAAKAEEPWLGGKKGLFLAAKEVPVWLSRAYKKNVLQANQWRDKPQRYRKDTAEFDPVEGPVGFRDKQPEWMMESGSGIWETKLSVSRKAARSFGSYRKTMWKLDKEVKLLPCDGADKDTTTTPP
ncbi:hypothetical protein B484DRAFT_417584 [Ochromonadaceae sp. CCMP2298]|nr:hypothetical protein B484DRAFT_417584 [Ochromonadaceae sp. CCMP2298]|mmetsp:Transcript_191/g.379  ORF Transcript_191/g.379 Transcript_191/m.379 type:complete len:583 (-) Transcript_191:139-1887(-)|eukprot:CAMPEP_0173190200 /NCGR_PEP_ID=MMETSP1141-20130122/12216_1 /TAXON_ID=483371 /ORGANISM="non described non described, Strain CCMP2298" /LENGTH=582 /DNA_ID=CAMNT_0014114289 /DNA_START=67 /DNA_END=1815 /DNA_ORIENTATION=+